MSRTEAEKKAQLKYAQKFQRPGIYMTAEKLDLVKAHAQAHGESVNAFANRAIDETIQRDNGQAVPDATAALIEPKNALTVELEPRMKAEVEQAATEAGVTVSEYIAGTLDERAAQEAEQELLDMRGETVVPLKMSNAAFKRIRTAADAAGARLSDYIVLAVTDCAKACQSATAKPRRRRAEHKKENTAPQQMELAVPTEAAQSDAAVNATTSEDGIIIV